MFQSGVKDQIKLHSHVEYETRQTDSLSVKSLLSKNWSSEGRSDELKTCSFRTLVSSTLRLPSRWKHTWIMWNSRSCVMRSKERVFQMFHVWCIQTHMCFSDVSHDAFKGTCVFQTFLKYFFRMAVISKWFNISLKVIKMFETQFKI